MQPDKDLYATMQLKEYLYATVQPNMVYYRVAAANPPFWQIVGEAGVDSKESTVDGKESTVDGKESTVDGKESTLGAAQLDASLHQVKKGHCADISDKENAQSLPATTANFSQQISEHVQPTEPVLSPVPQRTRPLPSCSPPLPSCSPPLSSCSPPLSPFSSISEQREPSYLSDPNENDSLWNEVIASTKPVTQPHVRMDSLIKSLCHESTIFAEETPILKPILKPMFKPMFKWSVAEGTITESDYKQHWLHSLQPEDSSEEYRLRNLASISLEQLRVPPIKCGVGEDFQRLAALAELRWRDAMFHYLFPFGSETPSLFTQLGYKDLHRLPLPSKSIDAEPPDRMYSVTAEIFPTKYRKPLQALLLNNKDYAAPYLTVFLTKPGDEESSGRMELWGAYMLYARVTEWCLATNKEWPPATNKPPPIARSARPTTSRIQQPSTHKGTKTTIQKPTASSKVQPEVGERVKGAPYHYSVALEHVKYSIWRFELDLRMTPEGIKCQGVIRTKFKENSLLLSDWHWSSLASDLLGIHLASAHQAGILVKGAVALMGPSKAVNEALLEPGPEVWRDDGREETSRADWASALEEN